MVRLQFWKKSANHHTSWIYRKHGNKSIRYSMKYFFPHITNLHSKDNNVLHHLLQLKLKVIQNTKLRKSSMYKNEERKIFLISSIGKDILMRKILGSHSKTSTKQKSL